jgi:multiple sugar transport system substrate-binding protein
MYAPNVKSLFVVTLLIAMVVMGGLCPSSVFAETVELVFRQNDPPNQIGEELQMAIDAWNKAHPDIQVQFETVPWSDALEQYVRESQAGAGPDVLQLAFVWTRDLAKSDLVMNLNPYLESSAPGAGIDDFLGVDLGEYEGGIYGIPWSVDTFAMAYRPDLLDQAGIAFPETWAELPDAAQQLTADTDGDGRTDQYGFCFQGGSGPTGGMWFLANYYLWSHGQTFIRETDDGAYEVGVTADELANAMTYFNAFFTGGMTPESMIAIDSWGDPEYTSSLGRGDCAILFLPPAAFRAAQKQAEMPLATAPDPKASAGRLSHMGGRVLAMNPNTEHPDAAWEFLKFLTTKDFYANYYPGYFPPQKSLLEKMQFPQDMRGYVEQLPHAITFKTYIVAPPPVKAMWNATNREFGAVYSGQKEEADAAADLLEEMENLLK